MVDGFERPEGHGFDGVDSGSPFLQTEPSLPSHAKLLGSGTAASELPNSPVELPTYTSAVAGGAAPGRQHVASGARLAPEATQVGTGSLAAFTEKPAQ